MLRRILFLVLLAACSRSPVKASPPEGTGGSAPPVEICDDHKDNDGNHLVDCADPACASDPGCPRCGDGYYDPREACDGNEFGEQTCASLQFNGGGVLHCTADCQIDTSGCFRHEDCSTPGDEDGNGLADCADPACVSQPGCVTLSYVEGPARAPASSLVELAFKAANGAGPLVGRTVDLQGPAADGFPPEVVSDADGIARFAVRLGRLSGPQHFTASLEQTEATMEVAVFVMELPQHTIATVLDAVRMSGNDESGPAVTAHVGAPIGIQVAASDGTLYVAESCRVLAVSPEGLLSRLLGTGSCGMSPADGDPLLAQVSVSGIALDEARGTLFVADPAAGLVRALDLKTGGMAAVAGFGKVTPENVFLDPAGKVVVHDSATKTFRSVDLASGTLATTFAPGGTACVTNTTGATSDCQSACGLSWDAAGTPFVNGVFCNWLQPQSGSPWKSTAPGIARYDGAGVFSLVAGRSPGQGPTGVSADLAELGTIGATAFDPAGNLVLVAGNALYRIDGTTGFVEKLAGDQAGFAGDGVALGAARFSAPASLAFGPGGDLYIADTGNGVVRRIAGLAKKTPTAGGAELLAGDGQTVSVASWPLQPITFRLEDGDGHPLAGARSTFTTDDPALLATLPDHTDGSGTGQAQLRAGLRVGTSLVQIYLAGIHGQPAGKPADLTLNVVEPPRGTVLNLSDGSGRLPVVGKPGSVLSAPGLFTDVRIGSDGTVYLISQSQVFSVDRQGLMSVIGGDGTRASIGSSGPAVAASFQPTALELDEAAGRLLVADATMVRTIDLANGAVGPLAGPGSGFPEDGDGGPALDATFGTLSAIALEPGGIIDLGSNATVRRIGADGVIRRVLSPANCDQGDGFAGGVRALATMGPYLWMSANACQSGGYPWIQRLDADGQLTNLYGSYPLSILPLADGTLLVGSTGWLYDLDPTTDTMTTVSDRLNVNVGGMAYDPDGHLWITDGLLEVLW